MKIIKIMGDEYITEYDAFELFSKKSDDEKVKILMDALIDKCGEEHARYMVLKQVDEVSYSDMWGSDEDGFLYKYFETKQSKRDRKIKDILNENKK